MCKIIGADKKEYGPVSADQLHQWISEGRANAQSLVQLVGSAEWKPLSAFPEFAEVLKLHAEPFSASPPLFSTGVPPVIIAYLRALQLSQVATARRRRSGRWD